MNKAQYDETYGAPQMAPDPTPTAVITPTVVCTPLNSNSIALSLQPISMPSHFYYTGYTHLQ